MKNTNDAKIRIKGHQAIEAAERDSGIRLDMYTSPIEESREGLTISEARAVAAEDPSLIYADVAYPARVADEVAALRPDLCAGDAVASVLTTDPTLTADEVIAILDEATEEWAAERREDA